MDELTAIEKAWVAYAHDLLDDRGHLRRCSKAGGSPIGSVLDPQNRLDSDLRWPGYLGREYRPGGVLCVAMVHRDFESNGAGPEVRADIVEGTRGLRDRTITDTEYLERVRSGYEAGLAKWVVGGSLGKTLDALSVPLTSVAYVNAARCQVPENWSHLPDKADRKEAKATCNKIKEKVLKLCWADYPITRIVGLLRPSFVLFANAPTYKRYDRAAPTSELTGVASACIHAWKEPAGTLLRPLHVGDLTHPEGTPLQDWAPTVRALLESEGTN